MKIAITYCSVAILVDQVLDDVIRLEHGGSCVRIDHERELALPAQFLRLWAKRRPALRARVEDRIDVQDRDDLTDLQEYEAHEINTENRQRGTKSTQGTNRRQGQL